MRAALILIIAMAALALLATAWTAVPLDGEFRFTSSGSVATLDPASMSWIQDLRLASLLYEGLYVSDPVTMQPSPAVAERVDVDASRREYTFYLRRSARWSNGEAVTAGDFVFAWRRALEPGTAADYAFFFDEIEGVADYVAWRWSEVRRMGAVPTGQRAAAVAAHLADADRRFGERVQLRALDPHTLWMRLRRPIPYWLDVVSFAVTYPLHRGAMAEFRQVGDAGLIYYDEQWAKPRHTPSNGPFVLTDWWFKRGMRLERNAQYWDAGRIKIKSVAYFDVADDNTAWLMYASGALDWMPSIEASFAPALAAMTRGPSSRKDIHLIPAFGTYFYRFNCGPEMPGAAAGKRTRNPFADPRVRRAFSLAVDRAALVASVTRRGEPPATAFVPYGVIPWYPYITGLGFDPVRAREELAAAGYPGGRGFPEVVLLYNTDGEHGLIAESIAQMWKTTLGVETRLTGKEVQSFREDARLHRFMICRASWYGDYLDPTSFLDTLRRDNGNNDSAYDDPAYDALLDAAQDELNPESRLATLAQAERRVAAETCPILPLFQYVHVSAFDPARVRGLHMNPRLVLSLKDVEVEP